MHKNGKKEWTITTTRATKNEKWKRKKTYWKKARKNVIYIYVFGHVQTLISAKWVHHNITDKYVCFAVWALVTSQKIEKWLLLWTRHIHIRMNTYARTQRTNGCMCVYARAQYTDGRFRTKNSLWADLMISYILRFALPKSIYDTKGKNHIATVSNGRSSVHFTVRNLCVQTHKHWMPTTKQQKPYSCSYIASKRIETRNTDLFSD